MVTWADPANLMCWRAVTVQGTVGMWGKVVWPPPGSGMLLGRKVPRARGWLGVTSAKKNYRRKALQAEGIAWAKAQSSQTRSICGTCQGAEGTKESHHQKEFVSLKRQSKSLSFALSEMNKWYTLKHNHFSKGQGGHLFSHFYWDTIGI